MRDRLDSRFVPLVMEHGRLSGARIDARLQMLLAKLPSS